MKLSKNKKLKNKLVEWFNELNVPHHARVVWCKEKDGDGFDETKTTELQESLEAIGYTNVPQKWGDGYVLPYQQIGSTKKFYKDPWTGEAVIDPTSPLNTLSKDDMALLTYGIGVGNYSRPKFQKGLERFLNDVKNKEGDWEDIQTMFDELPISQQAKIVEGLYFEKKSKQPIIDPLEASLFAVDAYHDLQIDNLINDPIIQKRVMALRKDMARELDTERRAILEIRLNDLLSEYVPQSNVKDSDILTELKSRYGFNQAPLNELVLSLRATRSQVIEKLHTLRENGWVILDLLEDGSAGLISLTSAGYKVAQDKPQKVDSGEAKHLKTLLDTHKRVLHQLKLQEARMGISTPVSTLLEIQDKEKEIAEIELKLRQS